MLSFSANYFIVRRYGVARSRRTLKNLYIWYRLTTGRKTFTYCGAKLYNSIAKDTRDTGNLNAFKKRIFKYHQGALSPNNGNTVQVSLPSLISFYVPFPHHICKLGVFGCTLYRDDDVSLLRSRNKTWLSSFLVYLRHWTNHA